MSAGVCVLYSESLSVSKTQYTPLCGLPYMFTICYDTQNFIFVPHIMCWCRYCCCWCCYIILFSFCAVVVVADVFFTLHPKNSAVTSEKHTYTHRERETLTSTHTNSIFWRQWKRIRLSSTLTVTPASQPVSQPSIKIRCALLRFLQIFLCSFSSSIVDWCCCRRRRRFEQCASFAILHTHSHSHMVKGNHITATNLCVAYMPNSRTGERFHRK